MILKAGCFLFNKERNKICLIIRKDNKGYDFPKGHLEKGESLINCALRETREETLYEVKLDSNDYFYINEYDNMEGHVKVYYFSGIENGITKEDINPIDKEVFEWVDIDKVYDLLKYKNNKEMWVFYLKNCCK